MNEPITLLEKEISKLDGDIALLNSNYDALVKAGLKKSKSAKEFLSKINELVLERKRVIEEDMFNRRATAAYMLLCIVAADFTCESVNLFARQLKKIFGKVGMSEDHLISILTQISIELEKVVVMMDKRTDKLSLNFAAMSDEITEKLLTENLRVASETIQRHMDAGNGRGLLLEK